LGALVGLFVGEYAGAVSFLGDAFIGLLQMTVLPYITLALIANIGKLEPSEGRRFIVYSGVFFLVASSLTLAVITMIPFSLPVRESAAFFSTSLIADPPTIDFVGLFIPKNPFHSLANNVVPAVVLFCIAMGVALITLDNKKVILEQLDFFTAALGRVNGYLVKLSPIGIFAIVASTSGTMSFEDLARLKDYMIISTVAALLLGFGVFPLLLASVTPFTYREIVSVSRAPLLMAFVTGKVLIALPLLIESAHTLFEKYHEDPEQPTSTARAVAPLVYPFPHAGKLMSLLFVPFGAWFVGSALKLSDYPQLLSTGFFSLFGSPVAAIPFLLNIFRIPSDLMQLFFVSGIFTARLGDMLGATHILFVSVLTAAALNNMFTLRWAKVGRTLLGAVAICVVATLGTRALLTYWSGAGYTRDQVIKHMHSAFSPSDAKVHKTLPPTRDIDRTESALERILRTGVIRVGYDPNGLPMSFFNADGELVGYDIDVAHVIARSLGVKPEFMPFEMSTLALQLDSGDFDVAMSGIGILGPRLLNMRFTDSYLKGTIALVVRDHRRDEIAKRIEERDYRGLRVAPPRNIQGAKFVNAVLPGVEVVQIGSPREFFESGGAGADAIIWSAESGSAWTLLYPHFSVIPIRPITHIPLAYAVAPREVALAEYISRWLEVFKGTSFDDRLYDHWILGKTAVPKTPRWSVIRNVLGWVK
jgi:Na+/H+-dicarboxylate symporter